MLGKPLFHVAWRSWRNITCFHFPYGLLRRQVPMLEKMLLSNYLLNGVC